MSELPEILSEMAEYASSDISERNLRQAAIHIRSAETEIERLTAKVEALEGKLQESLQERTDLEDGAT